MRLEPWAAFAWRTGWRSPVLLAAAPLLLACVRAPAPQAPVELVVAGDGDECRFLAAGRTLTARQLGKAARSWRGRGVSVAAQINTMPFRCLGLAIETLERAGAVSHIGFISEPPLRPAPAPR